MKIQPSKKEDNTKVQKPIDKDDIGFSGNGKQTRVDIAQGGITECETEEVRRSQIISGSWGYGVEIVLRGHWKLWQGCQQGGALIPLCM